jgi:uncharacterized protein involved in cysteine biosynthesis
MQRHISNTFFSLRSLFSGFHYVGKNSWTWKFIIGAIIVNIIVFGLVFYFIFLEFNSGVESLVELARLDLSTVVGSIVKVLLGILSFVISTFLFINISNIINAPIYGQLAEDYIVKNSTIRIRQFTVFEEITRSIGFEFKKVILMILLFIISLLLNLIPVVGSVLFVIFGFFQLIVFAGLDLFDPYLAKLNLSFRGKLKYIIKNPPKYYPFLFLAGFILTLPVINIFVFPFFVISGLRLVLASDS